MASKIRVLTDHTINKIAAGEVIENPASVIKELVENSLDAGATDICVEIKGGGRQLIRVTDNGCGMSPDDALLCLERHATSKIREVEDLHSIDTMGFRGEAIPSIASISKFTLLTCPAIQGSDPIGTMVVVDGGKIFKCCQAACPSGTTIEVKSLFFNVPVRKKFQKSPIYDANEICKTMSLLALGYPHIKFQLINNEKTVLSAPLSSSKITQEQFGERISSVLGDEFFRPMLPLEGSKGECLLQGFIGLPSFTRQNRTGQYLFINKRAVYSPFISYTIREGYGPSIGSHRHPVFVLNLSLPGNFVDVNVHPQKKEVRLRQEYLLKDMIIQSVEKAMQGVNASPFADKGSPLFERPPFMPTYEPAAPYISFPQERPREVLESKPAVFLDFPSSIQRKEQLTTPSFFSIPSSPPVPRVIATIPSYIIVDPMTLDKSGNDGLCLVDQRTAHCRIVFEKLMKTQQNDIKDNSITMQSLLIPYTLETSSLESSLLLEKLDHLNSLGISIKEFGPNVFVIDAIPQVFGNTDVKEFVADIVQSLHESKNRTGQSKEHIHQIALAASRAAISKNKKLPLEEAQALLNQLMRCESPYQCPLGKPTMARINSDELAKQFK